MRRVFYRAPFYAVGAALMFLMQTCSVQRSENGESTAIEKAMLEKQSNFYNIDFSVYAKNTNQLPIGVFDSGTGGLTVLNALLEFDGNGNHSLVPGADGKPDFMNEKFIYLADQANMPYGNYYSENKSGLLIEHIAKDAQFLLSNKYYQNAYDAEYKTDKEPVKIIVIACNTATAYGKEYLEDFLRRAKIPVKVIGVIDAGARGALEMFKKNEDGSVGVLATVGTIASKGYENALQKIIIEQGYTGNIMIFNQGGHGIAEAVDEETDFVDRHATQPRDNYRGPSWDDKNYTIDKALWDIYNFDMDAMLCEGNQNGECEMIQLNSPGNYVRYHLVSLMEKIRKTPEAPPLKTLLLGCTHYPYLSAEIKLVLDELYHYQWEGVYVYRKFMSQEIKLVDPAFNVAKELHAYMKSRNAFNIRGSMRESEFYISVPNILNPKVEIDSSGRFTYAYKYGRREGELQQYVKVVPFSRQNISEETLGRLQKMVPVTHDLVVGFSQRNPKTKFLREKELAFGVSLRIQ